MSTSRHIDAICAVVTVLTVLLALLFMNGEALGIEPIAGDDADTGQFTDNDLDGDWDSSNATRIDLTAGAVTGNGAYIVDGDVHIVYAGKYVLTGTLTDGSVIVEADGDDKVWLKLDGAELHCSDSAALDIEQAEKVFLTLADGTENAISGGSVYSEEAVAAGIDGAVYSRDDLTINGAGALTVTADYQHGIVCNDDLVITGGIIEVTAAQDALHANDSARIANAAITVTAGDDGVTVSNDEDTGYFYMQSGSLTVLTCYEGVEATNVTVEGGTIDIMSTDDGINASGAADGTQTVRITGGDVRIVNTQGMDADGIDSNGNIYIDGGRVFISVTGGGSNAAIDYGSEYGGVCQVNGGTLIACGGSMMVESLDAASGQGFVETAATGGAGASLTLTDGSGNTLLDETIPCAFTYVMLSAPGMTSGGAYTLSVNGTESQVTANDTSGVSGGFGAGGGMMMGGGQMGGGQMGGGRGGDFFGQTRGQTTDQQPGGTDQQSEDTQSAAGADGEEAVEPPAMPGGQGDEQTQGQTQQMPQGFAGQPDMPQQGGEMPDTGGLPQQPGETPDADSLPQQGGEMPDAGGFPQQGGGMPGADAFTQKTVETAAGTGSQSTVSEGTWVLLAVSAVTLLAGIVIAAKYKH